MKDIYIDPKDYPSEFLLTLKEVFGLYKDLLNNPSIQMFDLNTDLVILNRDEKTKVLKYFVTKPVSKIN